MKVIRAYTRFVDLVHFRKKKDVKILCSFLMRWVGMMVVIVTTLLFIVEGGN